jgi:hypothetical protein
VGVVQGWSRFAIASLAVSMATSVVFIASLFSRLDVIARINDVDNPATADQADASDRFVLAAGVAWLVVYVVAAIAFIGWQFVCARQVSRVRPDLLRNKPGWAIGGWFIPFANLVFPPRVMNDIRRLGDVAGLPERRALVGWWWGVFLVANFGAVAVTESGNQPDLEALRGQTSGQIGREVLELVAAALAIAVVVSTTRRVVAGSNAAGWSAWQAAGYGQPYQPPPYAAQPDPGQSYSAQPDPAQPYSAPTYAAPPPSNSPVSTTPTEGYTYPAPPPAPPADVPPPA